MAQEDHCGDRYQGFVQPLPGETGPTQRTHGSAKVVQCSIDQGGDEGSVLGDLIPGWLKLAVGT